MSKMNEAFELLVERLVSEVRRNEGSADKLIAAARDLDETKLELTKTKAALTAYTGGAVAYFELYETAELAAKKLCTVDAGSDACATAALLRARVAKARKFIDPIPF